MTDCNAVYIFPSRYEARPFFVFSVKIDLLIPIKITLRYKFLSLLLGYYPIQTRVKGIQNGLIDFTFFRFKVGL